MITNVDFDLFCYIAKDMGFSNAALDKLFEYYLELDFDIADEYKLDSYELKQWVVYTDLTSLLSDNMFISEQVELKGLESDTDIIELINDYTRVITFKVDDKEQYLLYTGF